MEKEFVLYGGPPPDTSQGPNEGIDDPEQDDEGSELVPSVSGIMVHTSPDLFVVILL